jgi:hypothetical protein
VVEDLQPLAPQERLELIQRVALANVGRIERRRGGGNAEQEATAGLQHAGELRYRHAVVRDMLDDLRAHTAVEHL